MRFELGTNLGAFGSGSSVFLSIRYSWIFGSFDEFLCLVHPTLDWLSFGRQAFLFYADPSLSFSEVNPITKYRLHHRTNEGQGNVRDPRERDVFLPRGYLFCARLLWGNLFCPPLQASAVFVFSWLFRVVRGRWSQRRV